MGRSARGAACLAVALGVLAQSCAGMEEDIEHAEEGVLSLEATTAITRVSRTSSLSTPAQRHMVRIVPEPGAPAVLLLAVDKGSVSPRGLHWYRSDDDGLTWRQYAPILESSLHMTADAIVVGNDVHIVVSYDTPNTEFPSDSRDPDRKVYYQRWRFDGEDDWRPDPLETLAEPSGSRAYHRAEIQRDSHGRLWAMAWLRDTCPDTAGWECADTIRVWVSEDDGATWRGQQDLFRQMSIGGGRILHLGSRMVIFWGRYSTAPAQWMWRDDGEPIGTWHGPENLFPDDDAIYHGSALSAVGDGRGGISLVYKGVSERLYYREYDGQIWGPRVQVSGASHYSTQPAVTRRGDDVYLCLLHLVSTSRYEVRSFSVSEGLDRYEVLAAPETKSGYPTAPEAVGLDAPRIPCAYGSGATSPSVHVALRDVEAEEPPAMAPATPVPSATPIPTAPPVSSRDPRDDFLFRKRVRGEKDPFPRYRHGRKF